MNRILTLIKQSHGIIAFLGGLLIFFSWLITNTLQKDFEDARSGLASAQRWFEVDTSLEIIRTGVEKVSSELNRASRERKMNSLEMSDEEREGLWISIDFDQTQDQSSQITDLLQIIGRNLSLSRAVDQNSEFHEKIISMNQRFHLISETASNYANACHELFGSDDLVAIRKAVNTYHDYIYNVANPQVQEAFPYAVDFSNLVVKSASSRVGQLRQRSVFAKRVSLFSYLMGSIMLLFGGAVEKKIF